MVILCFAHCTKTLRRTYVYALATLDDVVKHDDAMMSLALTPDQQHDLVELLKSLRRRRSRQPARTSSFATRVTT